VEKFKLFVVFSIGCILLVLVYSLAKSWLILQDYSVKVNEPSSKKNVVVKEPPHDYLLENSRVLWKNYLFYPSELVREAGGFGPDEVMNHAKNLTFINLQTGKTKKVFKNKVYIHDFFLGEFQKKNTKNIELQREILDISDRLLIFAMTVDTNKDGFLNQKDLIKVFVYNPVEEKLYDILPEKYYFQKLLFNTNKNILVLIIKELNENKKEEEISSVVFTYNTITKQGNLIK
jgi:hypothetical protein